MGGLVVRKQCAKSRAAFKQHDKDLFKWSPFLFSLFLVHNFHLLSWTNHRSLVNYDLDRGMILIEEYLYFIYIYNIYIRNDAYSYILRIKNKEERTEKKYVYEVDEFLREICYF